MEVITMESEAFKELQNHLRTLGDEINAIKVNKIEDDWLDSKQVQKILGISQKTWQTYRDRKMIRFSQIGQKIYIKQSWLEDFILKHSIKGNF